MNDIFKQKRIHNGIEIIVKVQLFAEINIGANANNKHRITALSRGKQIHEQLFTTKNSWGERKVEQEIESKVCAFWDKVKDLAGGEGVTFGIASKMKSMGFKSTKSNSKIGYDK